MFPIPAIGHSVWPLGGIQSKFFNVRVIVKLSHISAGDDIFIAVHDAVLLGSWRFVFYSGKLRMKI